MSHEIHPLLRRQIKKHLPDKDPLLRTELRAFLEAIEASYTHFDRDREILERSMMISSEELVETNAQLKGEVQENRETMRKLMESIRILQAMEPALIADGQLDQIGLSSVAELLKSQVQIRLEAEHRLQVQKHLLKAVAGASNAFLQADSLTEGLETGLSQLFHIEEIKEIRLFQTDDSEQGFNLVFYKDVFPETQASAPARRPFLKPAQIDQLREGQIILARDKSRDQQPVNCLKLPILAYRRFWGILCLSVGLPETITDPDFYPIFQSLAQSIGGALQQELTRLEILSARDRAEQAMRAKSEFLSTMSHEIRTPLNAVIGFTQLLMDEKPREDQEDHLQTLKFSAENLLHLINDILDYSKIEAGKVELEHTPFEIRRLLNGIRQSLFLKVEEKGIRFHLLVDEALPQFLVGDPVRLGQVISNLASNAVKFTQKGSVTLQVLIEEQNEQGYYLKFSVKDTGIGIDINSQEIIFESFAQASNSTTRQFGGTGLGLAISKRLVEIHGSRLELESELGKGSEFFFRINMPAGVGEEASLPQPNKPKAEDLSQLRLLIAEDNPVNVKILVKFLEKWNITRIEVAPNGKQAVEMALSKPFDLILMDLHMPVMNGIEATQIIRSQDKETPIIALTADALPEAQIRVFEIGMDDFVTKPFNPNILYERIQRLYAHRLRKTMF